VFIYQIAYSFFTSGVISFALFFDGSRNFLSLYPGRFVCVGHKLVDFVFEISNSNDDIIEWCAFDYADQFTHLANVSAHLIR